MARHLYRVPASLIADRFDNAGTVAAFEGPVLVVHGEHDEMIPFAHGQRLAALAPDARLVAYPAGHNDCPPDWPAFWDDVTGFLVEVGLVEPR